MAYGVTLERGADGTYLAWVDELPGCAVRGGSRAEVLRALPGAIAEFSAWAGLPAATPEIVVTEEVQSEIEADEDTEVLVAADRRPLTEEDWEELRGWLTRSRRELEELLRRLTDAELGARGPGGERTVREELEHVAFVELMYAVWTFDLDSREGLVAFLAWTREIAERRLAALAEAGAADLTWARWAGAPRPEPWTPLKAARRLVWHELLHLRALERFAEGADQESKPGPGGQVVDSGV